MEKKKVIGFYDYTVVLTYLGFVFAFTGILGAIGQEYGKSILCLMLAGICDMFDGAVASTKSRNQYEKHFGIQIDSLCDLISFGMLPAIIVYEISGENMVVGMIGCLFTLSGLIRLAYFNVQEYERQKVSDERREVYLGIPITTSAILLPIVYLIFNKLGSTKIYLMVGTLIFLGFGYVAGVEIKKPRLIGKVVMIVVGAIELVGIVIASGVDFL